MPHRRLFYETTVATYPRDIFLEELLGLYHRGTVATVVSWSRSAVVSRSASNYRRAALRAIDAQVVPRKPMLENAEGCIAHGRSKFVTA